MNKLVTYVMAIVALCATGFLVFWFLIQEPFNTDKEKIETEIRDAREQMRKYEKAKKDCKTYEEKINTTKKKIFTLLCGARGRTIEDFLKELETDSDTSKIELENIRIESMTVSELCSKIPMDLNISGPYFQIYKFLALVQNRGKMDFSGGSLSIASESKQVAIPKMKDYVSTRSKYKPGDRFPNLRVNVNGEIIIIDENTHMRKYRTSELSSCDGI